jgi:ligand-binding SRPBCC domain-containing protein
VSAPFTLEREQWVPSPLHEVFAFFADARNLETLTPEWLRFEILTPEAINMTVGTVIDYRLRWHGLPLRWKTEITHWEPPNRFEDLQTKGPYQLWRHTHRFEAVGEGTRIGDSVQYALPFGLLGRAVHAVSVRRNVEEIFNYRDKKVRALFGGNT